MDNYVYISVKLDLVQGQTHDSIQEIVQEMDYSFDHSDILGHEIMDIIDTQISEEPNNEYVDLFYMSEHLEEDST